jgi:hypothetical protein
MVPHWELEDVATAEDLTLSGTGNQRSRRTIRRGRNNNADRCNPLAASANIGVAAGTNVTLKAPSMAETCRWCSWSRHAGAAKRQHLHQLDDSQRRRVLEVNGQVEILRRQYGIHSGRCRHRDETESISNRGYLLARHAAGANIGTFDSSVMAWNGTGTMVVPAGVQIRRIRIRLVVASFNRIGTGFEFQFSDGATPPVPGVAYTLVSFTLTNFAAGDFSFTYAGTGPGSSMTGTFALTRRDFNSPPATVVSDLVFQTDSSEPATARATASATDSRKRCRGHSRAGLVAWTMNQQMASRNLTLVSAAPSARKVNLCSRQTTCRISR